MQAGIGHKVGRTTDAERASSHSAEETAPETATTWGAGGTTSPRAEAFVTTGTRSRRFASSIPCALATGPCTPRRDWPPVFAGCSPEPLHHVNAAQASRELFSNQEIFWKPTAGGALLQPSRLTRGLPPRIRLIKSLCQARG